MKTYTDLEQSKKLTEILPLESADMYWENGISDKYIQCFTPFVIDEDATNVNFDYDVPCWSLTALLGVLPEPQLIQNSDGRWMLRIWDKKRFPWSVGGNVNPVDACYEMIIKLNEQNLFKNYWRNNNE